MGNTAVKGYTDVWGKHGAAIYDHTGPASYVATGEKLFPNSLGLRNIDYVHVMRSSNGIYNVAAVSPSGSGGNATQITLLWSFATTGSIATLVTNVAGTGMTPGNVAPLTFPAAPAGGITATGFITVLTATTYSYTITNPGLGYTSAPVPTASSAATGGTAPTFTTTLTTIGQSATTGANLSGVSVRLLAIGG